MSRPRLAVLIRNFADQPVADWGHLIEQARAADDAGIDRIFLADHVAFGERMDHYGEPARGGMAGGAQPTGPDGYWLEPLTTIAAMATATRRVRLATNVLLAALRRPVVLAKTAATLDALSHGRFDLGVGVGWQEDEYRAAGVDFRARGRALDEALEVCRALWTQPVASYASPYPGGASLSGIHMMPKPAGGAGVPVWVGGTANRAAARRLARFGIGWLPWGRSISAFAEERDAMRALVEEQGRDFGAIRVAHPLHARRTGGGGLDIAGLVAPAPGLMALGVTDFHLLLRVPPSYAEAVDLLSAIAREFAAATQP